MMRITIGCVALLSVSCASGPGAEDPWPRTRAESSVYEETSLHEDVVRFMEGVAARSPILQLDSAGRSGEDRDLIVVLAADPPVNGLAAAAADPRPKVLVMANIHAGEVEGKEAVQEVVREIAQGRHHHLLENQIVVFLPDYNPDGNDALGPRNRPTQDGPAGGMGKRPNAQGLDLNRDFMKAEAPETRALLALFRHIDPLLTVDCHTTDGSYHGFDLTYAGPLSPATDPELLEFTRQTFLPELRRGLLEQGHPTFDYGNWAGNWFPESDPRDWVTFDHTPRFGTNYVGLRNRFSLLSEAYSHSPFEDRIAVTRALVLRALELADTHRREMQEIVTAADARACCLGHGGQLPADACLRSAGQVGIPLSSVRREVDPATGAVREMDTGVHTWIRTTAWVHFSGTHPVPVPLAWLLPDVDPAIRDLLEAHGIRLEELHQPRTAIVHAFEVTGYRRARRPFQGHRQRELQGRERRVQRTLPSGTLVVPADQRLARLAFWLLDPRSTDGLATWGLLQPAAREGGGFEHPVLMLREGDDSADGLIGRAAPAR